MTVVSIDKSLYRAAWPTDCLLFDKHGIFRVNKRDAEGGTGHVSADAERYLRVAWPLPAAYITQMPILPRSHHDDAYRKLLNSLSWQPSKLSPSKCLKFFLMPRICIRW
jgi:hypothetical protein